MVLVLLLLSAATILGNSYVTSTTVKVICTENLLRVTRAQYLAESGLEHALYVLQTNPELLANSAETPLGPFHVDNTQNSYRFLAVEDPEVPGRYVVTATADVLGLTRTVYLTVYRSADPEIKIAYGMMIGGTGASLPMSLSIDGDIHSNGAVLFNFSRIHGDVSTPGTVWDPFNWIDGEILIGVEPIALPDIRTDDYKSYSLDGVNCTAVSKTLDHLKPSDSLNRGGSIAVDNVGGVVWLQAPKRKPVTIKSNVDFQGTILVEGDLFLKGDNIRLTAVEGFPAVIVTGRLLIAKNASATIDGLVTARGGIAGEDGKARSSRTTINGGLICEWVGYSSGLEGAHELNYDANRCTLHDLSSDGAQGPGQIEIIDYD